MEEMPIFRTGTNQHASCVYGGGGVTLAHTGVQHAAQHNPKNGHLLHYLLQHAGAALCVNMLLQQLFPFVALHHANVTLCLRTLCGRGARVFWVRYVRESYSSHTYDTHVEERLSMEKNSLRSQRSICSEYDDMCVSLIRKFSPCIQNLNSSTVVAENTNAICQYRVKMSPSLKAFSFRRRMAHCLLLVILNNTAANKSNHNQNNVISNKLTIIQENKTKTHKSKRIHLNGKSIWQNVLLLSR